MNPQPLTKGSLHVSPVVKKASVALFIGHVITYLEDGGVDLSTYYTRDYYTLPFTPQVSGCLRQRIEFPVVNFYHMPFQ